jgi:serpin B
MTRYRECILTIAAVILLAAAASAAGSAGATTEVPQEDENGDIMKLSRSYNEFGFDLYATMLREIPDETLFISPTSIALALAVTLGGAAGTTHDAIAAAMHLAGMPDDDIAAANKALADGLAAADPGMTLSIANSLWLREDFPFLRTFIERSERFFAADVYNILHEDDINRWVDEKTESKISKIVERVEPDDIAYLINAIYFKGIWKTEFDPDKTASGTFHRTGGRTIAVDLMHRTGQFRYLENDSLQGVALPYGDGSAAMYVFLPKPETDLAAFNAGLNGRGWEALMNGFSFRDGTLALPRFRCECTASLSNTLTSLGMGIAFSGKADFSRMCAPTHGNVAIGRVLHKTYIDVNEEGTEAAAATAVGMKATAVRVQLEPFRMIVDRPFFAAIRDERSGSILFMGSILDPTPAD